MERQKLERLRQIVQSVSKQKRAAYQKYKELVIQTESVYEDMQAKYTKKNRDTFDKLRHKRNSAKETYRLIEAKYRKLEDKYDRNYQENERAIEAINEALERFSSAYAGTLTMYNVKIVPRDDGNTDVFFGGMYKAGDGEGHGHAVIDKQGNVVYLRDAWQNHKRYLISKK